MKLINYSELGLLAPMLEIYASDGNSKCDLDLESLGINWWPGNTKTLKLGQAPNRNESQSSNKTLKGLSWESHKALMNLSLIPQSFHKALTGISIKNNDSACFR